MGINSVASKCLMFVLSCSKEKAAVARRQNVQSCFGGMGDLGMSRMFSFTKKGS